MFATVSRRGSRRCRCAWRAGGLAVCLWAAAVCAGHAAAPDTLTLQQALERVMSHNPGLQAWPLRQAALDGDRAGAALLPPLRLSADAENFAGSGDADGLDGIEITLALSGVVEFGSRPAARVAIVDGRAERLDAEQRAAQLDVLAEAARGYIALAARQHALALARDRLELRRQVRASVAQRVQRGRAPAAEQARAEAAVVRAGLEVAHVEHQIPALRTQLAALWGDRQADFERVQDRSLFEPGSAGRLPALLAALEHTPDLARFNSELRLAQAQLRLEQSRAQGELGWRAGVKRIEATESTALVAGVSLPLGARARAAGPVRAARARADAAAQDRDAALVRSRALLVEQFQHRSHAIDEVRVLRQRVIPLLEQAVADTRAAWARGRYSYLELSAALDELMTARLALIDAAERAHLRRVELERLAGAALQPQPAGAAGDPPASARETAHDAH